MAEKDPLDGWGAPPKKDLSGWGKAPAPGEHWSNPIQEQGVTDTERLFLMNLGDWNTEGKIRQLSERGYEARDIGGNNLAVRRPGEPWKVIDPDTGVFGEVGKDLADFAPSLVAHGIGMAKGAGAGMAAAAPTMNPWLIGGAGVLGAVGGSMATEAALQGAGKLAGEWNPTLGEAAKSSAIEGAFAGAGDLAARGIGSAVKGARNLVRNRRVKVAGEAADAAERSVAESTLREEARVASDLARVRRGESPLQVASSRYADESVLGRAPKLSPKEREVDEALSSLGPNDEMMLQQVNRQSMRRRKFRATPRPIAIDMKELEAIESRERLIEAARQWGVDTRPFERRQIRSPQGVLMQGPFKRRELLEAAEAVGEPVKKEMRLYDPRDHVLRWVWDLDEKAWRSISLDNVEQIRLPRGGLREFGTINVGTTLPDDLGREVNAVWRRQLGDEGEHGIRQLGRAELREENAYKRWKKWKEGEPSSREALHAQYLEAHEAAERLRVAAKDPHRPPWMSGGRASGVAAKGFERTLGKDIERAGIRHVGWQAYHGAGGDNYFLGYVAVGRLEGLARRAKSWLTNPDTAPGLKRMVRRWLGLRKGSKRWRALGYEIFRAAQLEGLLEEDE